MSNNEPPPYPGDPNNPNTNGLPPYGSQPPNDGPPPSYRPPPTGPGSFSSQPTGEPFSVGAAVRYGWTKFKDNAGALIVAMIILFAITAIVEGIGSTLTSAAGGTSLFDITDTGNGPSFSTNFGITGQLVGFVASLVSTAVSFVISAGIIRGALDITEGRKFSLSEAFGKLDYAKVIITSIIVSVLVTIGLLLFVLPGIVVAFLTIFALYFVVDDGTEPVASIKGSYRLVKDNIGDVLVLFIASIGIAILGAIACLVGLLVAIPVIQIAWAYAYKRLRGEPVIA